ncbi:hypothetical protein SDC9_129404 [bioreactor metagenome]|uniref:Uncharacterized protein n=1 Tax=bioreactor metagenome TaxID=1076179 RepID=A0A645CZQ2_9ZZZZ
MLERIGHETGQPAAGDVERARHVGKHGPVAGDDDAGRQALDQVERGSHVGEAFFALQFGEHHAEAVFPERVARDHQPLLGLEQDDGVHVVPRRGVDLPEPFAQADFVAGCECDIGAKWRAMLAGGLVAQGDRVPLAHLLEVAGRDARIHLRPAGLQCCIAAAVVAVQMGVDEQIKRPALQRGGHQIDGLRRMREIAAVHQRRAVLALEQHVVGRKPAALQHGDVTGKGWSSAGHGGMSRCIRIVLCWHCACQKVAKPDAACTMSATSFVVSFVEGLGSWLHGGCASSACSM